MTIQTCVRCGQLLLPEIVRELGAGRRCPFCNTDLKLDAKAATPKDSRRDTQKAGSATAPQPRSAIPQPPAPAARAQAQLSSPPQPPARRSLPAAPGARPMGSPAAPTLPGMSAARVQTAAAAGLRIPEPLLAEPLPALEPSSPPWLVPLRRRSWLVAPAVLAVLVTIGLLVGHRPSGTTGGSSAPGPSAPSRPAATLASAPPLSPAKIAPDARNRIAAAERPIAVKDAAPATGGSRAATGHVKAGARAHATQRTHSQKKRSARPSRGKHTRLVALEKAAAPKVAGDERSARASYERGNQRLLTGDTAGAVTAYEEAVRSAPSSPSGYRGLGLAYEKEGKIAEAVRAFRHYLKLAPSSGDRDLVTRRLRQLLRPGDSGK